MGAYNFEILAEDSSTGAPSSFTVRMEYLFAFLLFGVTLLVGGCGVVGWGRKSYLGPAEISFSSRDLNRRNKHDLFWLVASTGYFCILFL